MNDKNGKPVTKGSTVRYSYQGTRNVGVVRAIKRNGLIEVGSERSWHNPASVEVVG